MGKITAAVDTGTLRVGNTIATPLRRWWELINEAVFNVLKRGKSSAKNTAEVGKQTIDALADNFLNFSKVQGKRYQRLIKWGINSSVKIGGNNFKLLFGTHPKLIKSSAILELLTSNL